MDLMQHVAKDWHMEKVILTVFKSEYLKGKFTTTNFSDIACSYFQVMRMQFDFMNVMGEQ